MARAAALARIGTAHPADRLLGSCHLIRRSSRHASITGARPRHSRSPNVTGSSKELIAAIVNGRV